MAYIVAKSTKNIDKNVLHSQDIKIGRHCAQKIGSVHD